MSANRSPSLKKVLGVLWFSQMTLLGNIAHLLMRAGTTPSPFSPERRAEMGWVTAVAVVSVESWGLYQH